jgi:hypothetical protein
MSAVVSPEEVIGGNGRGFRPGRPRGRCSAASSSSSDPGCGGGSSYVEKTSTSSSAPAPPHNVHRNRRPGVNRTIGPGGSNGRNAMNATGRPAEWAPFSRCVADPSSRPSSRPHIRQRTSPRTQSWRLLRKPSVIAGRGSAGTSIANMKRVCPPYGWRPGALLGQQAGEACCRSRGRGRDARPL